MLTSLYAGATIHLVPRLMQDISSNPAQGDECLSRGSNNVFRPVGIFGDQQTENRCSTSQVPIFRRSKDIDLKLRVEKPSAFRSTTVTNFLKLRRPWRSPSIISTERTNPLETRFRNCKPASSTRQPVKTFPWEKSENSGSRAPGLCLVITTTLKRPRPLSIKKAGSILAIWPVFMKMAPSSLLDVQRIDHRSGFNIYPPELEGIICSHPDVRNSAVVMHKVPETEVVAVEPLQRRRLIRRLKNWLWERVAP